MAKEDGETNHAFYDQFSVYDFSSDTVFQEGWIQVKTSFNKNHNSDVDEEFLRSKLFYFSRLCGSKLTTEGHKSWMKKKDIEKTVPEGCSEDDPVAAEAVGDNLHCKIDRLCVEDRLPQGDCGDSHQRNASKEANEKSDINVDSSTGDCQNLSHSQSRPAEQEQGSNPHKDMCSSTHISKGTDCPASTDKEADHSVYPQTHSDGASVIPVNKSDNLSFEQVVQLIQKGEAIPGMEELSIQPTNSAPTKSTLSRLAKPWETKAEHNK